MSRRWKILIWVLIIGGVLVGLPVATHYRAKAAVERYRKQLQKQGERLTIAELIPKVSEEGQNGGPALVRAAGMRYSSPTNYIPMMRNVAPGHALVAWAEPFLPSDNSTNIWPALEAEILARHDALAGIHAALQYPTLQFDLDYSQGWLTLLPHLAPMKGAELSLDAVTVLELHEGQATNAWEDLKSCVAEVRLYRCEPFIISHLVQIACGQIALGATWEALQYPGWSEEQLAELQKNWEAVDYWEGTESALSMEQVIMSQGFEELRSSYSNYTSAGMGLNGSGGGPSAIDDLGQMLANPKEGFGALMNRYPGYWAWKYWVSHDEELYALQNLQASLDAARITQKEGAFVRALEKLNNAKAAIRRLHAASEERFVIARTDAQIQTSFLTKIANAEMARRMLVTSIALKRYQLQHGKYPGQLADLKPQYLHELPMDVMDGKALRYRPKDEGGFLLYSVGEDGQDNGGDPTPPEPALPNNRSPWWWKGRDAVWPMPATAEEVKEYEDKIIAKVKQNQEMELSRRADMTNAPPVVPEPGGTNANTKRIK
jgi:hypothetical protein